MLDWWVIPYTHSLKYQNTDFMRGVCQAHSDWSGVTGLTLSVISRGLTWPADYWAPVNVKVKSMKGREN